MAVGAYIVVSALGLIIYFHLTAEKRDAIRIISRIETFRELHGRLPDPEVHKEMKDLGFELQTGWTPDYRAVDANHYQITILSGFDGPHDQWDSSLNQWREVF